MGAFTVCAPRSARTSSKRQAERGELVGIDADADRRTLLAVKIDEADAGDLRNLLGDENRRRSGRASVSGSVGEVKASDRMVKSAGLTL